jgi:hypothetical protein
VGVAVQAHWMGVYAAQSMLGRTEDFGVDTKFELFTHITRFFGHKVSPFLLSWSLYLCAIWS